MKLILFVIPLFAMIPSCAEYEGATYVGNGDAGVPPGAKVPDFYGPGITSHYRARSFLTDLNAGSFSARKAVVSKQNQSKVALSAIRTAGTVAATLGAAKIAAEEATALGAQHVAIEKGAQQAATTVAVEKEVTQRAADALKLAPKP